MNQYENNIMSSNRDALICGIDEVGRGPLAGPVVAVVILEKNHHYIGLRKGVINAIKSREKIFLSNKH